MDNQTPLPSTPPANTTPQPSVPPAQPTPSAQPVQFSSTQPVQPQPSAPTQPSAAMQIQQLLVQQQQLQQQYNQIVAFLKTNPQLTSEKTQEIKAQLDQLNIAYLQKQEQLKALGYNSIQVNKPVDVKQGAKNNFSYKKFAIGCVVLLLILGGLFAVILMSLTKNANALAGVGITATTAKTLLSMFAGLIVGVIGLMGLGFLLTNIYRLITVKNQSKTKYVLGLLGAFALLGVAGGIAGVVFGQIGKIIIPEAVPVSTSIIEPYLVGKEGATRSLRNVQLIAPAEMSFELNMPIWENYVASLGEVEVKTLTLNCGNPQQQTLFYQNTGFNGKCFYDKKGDYPVSITVSYNNLITKEERLTTERSVGTLSFKSAIQLLLGNAPLITQNGELNLGKAPAKITIDTTAIFRDFNVPEYHVVWDMDGDNTYEREDMVRFDYTYKLPKVYYPTVKFPDISDFVYSFPLRVEQSDVPICEIILLNFEKTKYKIQTNFLAGSVSSVANYSYSIIDTATNTTIATLKEKSRDIDYTFPEVGNYLVGLDFITVDGKRGRCESEPLQLAKESLNVKYTLKQKAA
ncbi:MAG: hypothetical protein LBP53_06175 [Candidatus Peribacteria bacterium]|jgi:hypothetical protein|nr:hypothetical protein [Candidatus Peribacteria bacterium]